MAATTKPIRKEAKKISSERKSAHKEGHYPMMHKQRERKSEVKSERKARDKADAGMNIEARRNQASELGVFSNLFPKDKVKSNKKQPRTSKHAK